MPAWLEKIKAGVGLGGEPEEQGTQGLLSQLDEATTLNRTQRMIGFAACFGLGMLLTCLVSPPPEAPPPCDGARPAPPCAPPRPAYTTRGSLTGPNLCSQSPMFLLRPTKFAVIYSLGSILSLGRYAAASACAACARAVLLLCARILDLNARKPFARCSDCLQLHVPHGPLQPSKARAKGPLRCGMGVASSGPSLWACARAAS